MRLLYAVVTLPLKLSLEIARAVGLVKDDHGQEAAVRVPPEPNFFRPRPKPSRSRGNGGAPPVVRESAPPPREPESAHVSEEPELVAASAERGAEEGAGAEVHVDEPWPGYGEMRAADIARRLRTEPPEVAAAVSLYEAAGKGRSSVLEAAARKVR
jgi:hypothetical protein